MEIKKFKSCCYYNNCFTEAFGKEISKIVKSKQGSLILKLDPVEAYKQKVKLQNQMKYLRFVLNSYAKHKTTRKKVIPFSSSELKLIESHIDSINEVILPNGEYDNKKIRKAAYQYAEEFFHNIYERILLSYREEPKYIVFYVEDDYGRTSSYIKNIMYKDILYTVYVFKSNMNSSYWLINYEVED